MRSLHVSKTSVRNLKFQKLSRPRDEVPGKRSKQSLSTMLDLRKDLEGVAGTSINSPFIFPATEVDNTKTPMIGSLDEQRSTLNEIIAQSESQKKIAEEIADAQEKLLKEQREELAAREANLPGTNFGAAETQTPSTHAEELATKPAIKSGTESVDSTVTGSAQSKNNTAESSTKGTDAGTTLPAYALVTHGLTARVTGDKAGNQTERSGSSQLLLLSPLSS